MKKQTSLEDRIEKEVWGEHLKEVEEEFRIEEEMLEQHYKEVEELSLEERLWK